MNQDGIFEQALEEEKIKISKGDIIIFYTDGVTESMDFNQNYFGDEKLKKIVSENYYKSADEIKDSILQYADRFSTNVQDDLTLIVMKKV